MALTPGTKLGPYEIVAPLGAGGMGEVYRAKDTRLDRPVAIKALPDEYALHPERMARFEREAKLLASLSHPNIAGIHGLERVGGHVYLALEFVEGETLAARLRRGPLAVREALAVARQVAAAIEAAHESGIIHRDLKPGNVMLRPDGEVKVLDFGLAKGSEGSSASDPGLSASPTLTFAATAAGVILGTAAYMSPEQARGKGVDRRTDIWSFGCVLYECLAGRQTFEGETVSDLIARILEREPDWNGLPAATPPAVRELLQRCLEKDPKQRLRDIGDARLTLEREIAAASSSGKLAAARGPRAGAARSPLALAALLALAAAAGAGGWALLSRGAAGARGAPPFSHVSITLPSDPRIFDGRWSPDGKRFAFLGTPSSAAALGEAGARIYVRRQDSFDLVPLDGTEGASGLEFTPDSRWIVFRAPLAPGAAVERLARVPADGSVPPVTLVQWNPLWSSFAVLGNGDLLFLDEKGERLTRLPSGGGAAREARVERGDLRATFKLGRALPGDHAVFVEASVYRERGWSIEVAAIDLDRNRLVMLGQEGGNASWSPTGHVLFSRGDVLLAAPFDPRALALRGTPIAVASGLYSNFSYLPGDYQLGPDGTLLVVPGGAVGNQRRLGMVDAEGRLRTLDYDPEPYQSWPSPAEDGHTFGVRITNAQGIDEIWAGDLGRPGLRRVAAWPAADCVGLFLSSDGRFAAFARVGRDSLDGVYVADLRGTGPGRRVVAPESTTVRFRVDSWSPDGAWLVLMRAVSGEKPDLWIARLSAARDSALSLRPLRATAYTEEASDFAPDGKWIAWESDESGRAEIYVAPFAADGTLGSPVRLTEQGGIIPEWLGDGRHLAVRSLDGRRVRIVDAGSPPGTGPHPVRDWFDMGAIRASDALTLWDGRAMVVLRGPREGEGATSLNLVFGWTAELQRRLAAGR